ncbi:MAG: DUF1919 domain-containing protein, partial [Bacteroidales bacterium]|nr:DUF1919 domain-containing protein [Bacteroidales bacterium]
EDFCIISSNCWAGHVYQSLNKPYNTPFVGLFINAPDYIKLLQNFDQLMESELDFKLKSKYESLDIYYQIGVLPGDIEIHFMHYKSEAEAFDKWNRRKKRMLKEKNRIFVKFDDRDFCEQKHIDTFHKLDFINKISFTKKKYNYENNLLLKNEDDLILLFSTVGLFDIPEWLNTAKIKNSKMNKIITKLLPYPVSWTH